MQPGLEVTRNIEQDLEDLDETDQAIERLGKRIEAQEQRIAHLKKDGIDSETAEQIRASMCDSLKELIKHRALIVHAITYRQ
jgi:Spy/CpxP family protein refolding chaperone